MLQSMELQRVRYDLATEQPFPKVNNRFTVFKQIFHLRIIHIWKSTLDLYLFVLKYNYILAKHHRTKVHEQETPADFKTMTKIKA